MRKHEYLPNLRRRDGRVCRLILVIHSSNVPWGKRGYATVCGEDDDFPKGHHPRTQDAITCLACIAEGTLLEPLRSTAR